ncbi:hypothetical protein ACN4EG_01080 [Alkalinema pantanalense CENA528]|uniref:hypothetical protein n=1 Tax=Alkalinema pantanalense TaxID=1620705 RepID=UPI003D6F0A15
MSDSQTQSVNVDQIIQRIREEAAQRSSQPMLRNGQMNGVSRSTFMALANEVELLTSNAELRAHVRAKWPDKLNRFPFSLSKNFQKGILKILDLAFRDQREVNLNLVYALRKSLILQRALLSQLEAAQAQNQTQMMVLEQQLYPSQSQPIQNQPES